MRGLGGRPKRGFVVHVVGLHAAGRRKHRVDDYHREQTCGNQHQPMAGRARQPNQNGNGEAAQAKVRAYQKGITAPNARGKWMDGADVAGIVRA